MAKSVNMVVLAGVLGRDAETKFIPNGKPVTKFSIATSYSVKRGDEWVEETDWHNVTLWGHEKLAEYLVKGSKVTVMGKLKNRSWEDKNGEKRYATDVVADEVVLQSSAGNSGQSGYAASSSKRSDAIMDDDVPF